MIINIYKMTVKQLKELFSKLFFKKPKINSEEIWKDIPGYKGYYKISNLGRIQGKNGKLLKLNVRKVITVVLSKNNIKKTYSVSLLMLKTFKKNINNDVRTKFKDGNNRNLNLDNLEYETPIYKPRRKKK